MAIIVYEACISFRFQEAGFITIGQDCLPLGNHVFLALLHLFQHRLVVLCSAALKNASAIPLVVPLRPIHRVVLVYICDYLITGYSSFFFHTALL